MPTITYLSHSGFLVTGERHRLAVDPFLTGNGLARHKPQDIRVDYILLTHGHGDHLGDSVEIARANDATIIAPFELANYCQSQGVRAHPMSIGGSFTFPFGRVKLTIAHHASSLPDGTYAGQPAGILLFMDGKTLYHAGDTGLFLDMQLIGGMNDIDVALLPIGDNFTMGIADAVKAAEFLKPSIVVPMHYNTFDVIAADAHAFVSNLSRAGMTGRVLEPGDELEY